MYKVLLFSILIFASINSFSQSFWKIENEYGDEILLTVVLNDEKETFEAFTRKDALKDIAGSLTYTLAKTAGKLKHAEIVFIEGNIRRKNDSLFLRGIFYYFDKHFQFAASISGNQFTGKYIDGKSRSHPLIGIKVPDKRPIKDYPSIIDAAFSLTGKYLFSSAWLKSDEWLNFRQSINELKFKITDDYELAASFFWLGKKLPFSPLEISKKAPLNKSGSKESRPGIRELKFNTAFFDMNMLPVTGNEVDSIAKILERKGYDNLIIDLRGNSKIYPGIAVTLMNYLSDRTFYAGVYLTRKWFDNNSYVPKSQDYRKLFKNITDNRSNVTDIYSESGRYLNIVPRSKTFKGKVYVLIDSKTSKVAESLAFILKNEKIATIVGQKTSGASILTEKLFINNEYSLVLSVSDYYTCEGKSLNKSGVEPDITVSGEDPLTYILKSL